MKYIFQFSIIFLFIVIGELLEVLLPFPVAGSIYGLCLLFLCLCFGVVKLKWVKDIAHSLHSIMALFFIAPCVAVIDIWAGISNIWWILVLILIAAYLITMITTGAVAEWLIKDKKKR